MHVQIKPGLRTAWRAPNAVQIGLRSGRGAVLEGLTTADRNMIEQLSDGLDEATFAGAGAQAERSRRLLGLLRSTDVLVARRSGRGVLAQVGPSAHRLTADAAVWGVVHPGDGDGWEVLAARSRCTVVVAGSGRLASALAEALAAAGIGTVEAVATPPAGRPDSTAPTDPPPDLVVLVRAAAADSVVASRLLAADIAHLSVVVGEAGLVVGPLVLPGRGPCLRCLDLHRTDRDPGWPRLLAQLPGRSTPADAGEAASSRLGAGLAALQVLAHLDSRVVGDEGPRPAAVGATLEVDLPDGLTSRRPWPVHPACGCASSMSASAAARPPSRRVTPSAPGPGQRE